MGNYRHKNHSAANKCSHKFSWSYRNSKCLDQSRETRMVSDRMPVMITVILFVRILMAYTYIESSEVVVWNDDISRHERTEAVITARVCRAGYGRQRSTVEVAFSKHVTCLVRRYFLHVVRPLASQLYCRLERLRPCLSVPHNMQCLYSLLSYTGGVS